MSMFSFIVSGSNAGAILWRSESKSKWKQLSLRREDWVQSDEEEASGSNEQKQHFVLSQIVQEVTKILNNFLYFAQNF